MLVDYDVLKKFGCTEDAIRALFTAKADEKVPGSTELAGKRKTWEDRIQSRIQEGALWGLKNHQFFQAADLAWDSNLITKELVPLQLYAQGKIQFKELAPTLAQLSPELQAKFIKKDEKGTPVGVNIPEFHKVVINLVRSLITKRTGSLTMRYDKQFPFFKYEPLGTSNVSKLRGDVLSQRVEIMTNQYGYRHDLEQSIRDMLLYGYSLEFPCSAWDRERGLRKKKVAAGMGTDQFEVEAFIAREGLAFKRVHPTRAFYDMAYPLSTINTDTGCTYAGHWNTVPYRTVCDNPRFFNRNQIQFDTSFASKLIGYRNYWALYSAASPINFPLVNGMSADAAGSNEREKITGYYSTEDKDRTIMLTEYFERVIPRDVGLGEYPYPVWVRLVVASDRTVVFGEIMPCTPVTYMGYNCSDSKVLNNSYAHDAMPFQDQMSNMFTNLLMAQRSALIKILTLDLDAVRDPQMINRIRAIVSGEEIYTTPMLVEYQSAVAADSGTNPKDILGINETQALADPTLYFRSILQVLALAERMLGTSANESAQSEPREISATESSNISQSVNTSLAFMGKGVDEAVAAKKRQIYEALMACGHNKIVVPVVNRYRSETIKAAGFEVFDETAEGEGLPENYIGDGSAVKRVTVTGEKQALVYEYNFSSRDGSERPSDPKAAEIMVRLLEPLSRLPGVIQSMGKTAFYDYLSTIVRSSGAGIDLKFEPRDGEENDDSLKTGDPAVDGKNQIEAVLQQVLDAIQQDRAEIARLKEAIGAASPPAPSPTQPAPI